jgi:hypothetical protein
MITAVLKSLMLKILPALTMGLTLACSCGLQAIGITINPNSTAASAVTLGEIHQSQVVVVAQQGVPYEFDTFASPALQKHQPDQMLE